MTTARSSSDAVDPLPASGESGVVRTPWLGPHLSLGLMLIVLHMGLMVGIGSGPSRAFLLAHFGLFLIWQPVWQGTDKLVPARAILIVVGGAALAWWSSWWSMALWIAALFALIGGNVPGMRALRPRLAPVLAAVYLLTVLLVWVVPRILGAIESQGVVVTFVRYVLPLPLLGILLVPAGPRTTSPRYPVDLVYSVMLLLMVVVLVLGALFVQQISQQTYAASLLQTVLGIAVLTIGLAWLWDPRGGFAGVGQLLSRYFLSLGMPFERWMLSLAGLAEREGDPDAFIASASAELLALSWITGVSWRTASGEGRLGETGSYGTPFELEGLSLTLHSRWRPSPGMLVHMGLLARLMGDYHEAKRREQAQRTLAYLQAIYETGSRVTHDVKNLLQSLRSLCAAAEVRQDADPQALLGLIQRQLPQITQRLQSTLEKLDARSTAVDGTALAAAWWRGLSARYAHEAVGFECLVTDERLVREDLFDSVADNLIQNALEKRRRGDCRRILVRLLPAEAAPHCMLEVADDGRAVARDLVSLLFRRPVLSDTGLGVGLYQCQRAAQAAGYDLRLARNENGEVVFGIGPM